MKSKKHKHIYGRYKGCAINFCKTCNKKHPWNDGRGAE